MKNDSALKVIVYSILGLVVFWLVKAVLFPTGYGMSVGYNRPGYFRNGTDHGYIPNYGMNSFGTSILQLFLIVFVIALVVSVLMILKNNVFKTEGIATIKESFTGKPEQVTLNCVDCGKELNAEWKVCPNCGKEVVNPE